jgi:transcriptional regulator with XRE-family HTH domain
MLMVKPMTKLQSERLRRGLTQTELAASAKLSASEVSRFETGMARPYPPQAARLAAVLQIPQAELLADSDESIQVRSCRGKRETVA